MLPVKLESGQLVSPVETLIPMLQVTLSSVVRAHAIQALRAVYVSLMLATAAGTPSK